MDQSDAAGCGWGSYWEDLKEGVSTVGGSFIISLLRVHQGLNKSSFRKD